MLDSLYGNLLGGPTVAAKPQPKASQTGPVSVDGPAPKGEADDIFAEPVKDASPEPAVPAEGPQPATAATAAAAAAAAAQAGKAEPNSAPLPQSFSAAKLMMPPVRKKAEPVGNKRPMMPSLDLSKLQEEKEALMRQRAAAAEKKDDKADEVVPATASTAPASAGAAATSAVQASSLPATSLYGNPDEEYDPAKPNDYDEFCRRRMRQKAEEEMEKRRQEAQARQQQASKAAEPKEDDFATRMLKKMGWKEGGGLGKEQQGMATPLVMKKTDRATGVVVEGQKREAAGPAAGQPEAKQPKAQSLNRPPTKVLLLNNLVGAGEVDEDLEGETAEEASKYGKLKRCVIREIKGVPDDQAVRIFLEYERNEDAMKAMVDMNGRYFGGRVVRARFYDEDRFEKGDLEKKDGQE